MNQNNDFVKYARKESTTDSYVTREHTELEGKVHDVVLYHDKQCKHPYARTPWYFSTKPTKRNRYYTINCFRWNLVWVD